MAEAPKSADQIVTELSQPGKEAELSKALTDEFNASTTPAEVKPAATDKVENNNDNPDNKDDLNKAGDNKAGEDNKNDRFKDLLTDRNEARAAAAEAQTEVQILSKKVEDQGKLIEKLLSGKAGEGDGAPAPNADELKGKTLQQLVNEEIDRREAAKNANVDAEKSITDAVQALESNPETPKAKEFSADIKALMAKHPTISAYMAYMALVGSGKIPTEAAPSNANRTGTGKRSKTNLVDNKPVGDQSQAELEATLRAAEKAGTLGV